MSVLLSGRIASLDSGESNNPSINETTHNTNSAPIDQSTNGLPTPETPSSSPSLLVDHALLRVPYESAVISFRTMQKTLEFDTLRLSTFIERNFTLQKCLPPLSHSQHPSSTNIPNSNNDGNNNNNNNNNSDSASIENNCNKSNNKSRSSFPPIPLERSILSVNDSLYPTVDDGNINMQPTDDANNNNNSNSNNNTNDNNNNSSITPNNNNKYVNNINNVNINQSPRGFNRHPSTISLLSSPFSYTSSQFSPSQLSLQSPRLTSSSITSYEYNRTNTSPTGSTNTSGRSSSSSSSSSQFPIPTLTSLSLSENHPSLQTSSSSSLLSSSSSSLLSSSSSSLILTHNVSLSPSLGLDIPKDGDDRNLSDINMNNNNKNNINNNNDNTNMDNSLLPDPFCSSNLQYVPTDFNTPSNSLTTNPTTTNPTTTNPTTTTTTTCTTNNIIDMPSTSNTPTAAAVIASVVSKEGMCGGVDTEMCIRTDDQPVAQSCLTIPSTHIITECNLSNNSSSNNNNPGNDNNNINNNNNNSRNDNDGRMRGMKLKGDIDMDDGRSSSSSCCGIMVEDMDEKMTVKNTQALKQTYQSRTAGATVEGREFFQHQNRTDALKYLEELKKVEKAYINISQYIGRALEFVKKMKTKLDSNQKEVDMYISRCILRVAFLSKKYEDSNGITDEEYIKEVEKKIGNVDGHSKKGHGAGADHIRNEKKGFEEAVNRSSTLLDDRNQSSSIDSIYSSSNQANQSSTTATYTKNDCTNNKLPSSSLPHSPPPSSTVVRSTINPQVSGRRDDTDSDSKTQFNNNNINNNNNNNNNNYNNNNNQLSQFAMNYRRIDILIYEYLSRVGLMKTASKLMRDNKLEGFVDPEVYALEESIVMSLHNKELGPALNWCGLHKTKLRKLNDALQPNLHLQQVIHLILNSKAVEAMAYIRSNLAPNDIAICNNLSQVMSLLAFSLPFAAKKSQKDNSVNNYDNNNNTNNNTKEKEMQPVFPKDKNIKKSTNRGLERNSNVTDESKNEKGSSNNGSSLKGDDNDEETLRQLNIPEKYLPLFSSARWECLADLFKNSFAMIHGLPQRPSLEILLQAGLSSLKSKACMESFSPSCPTCDPFWKSYLEGIPTPQHIRSHLVCPIKGHVLDDKDPPLASPDGLVFSTSAVEELSASSTDGKVECPCTGNKYPVDRFHKLFIS